MRALFLIAGLVFTTFAVQPSFASCGDITSNEKFQRNFTGDCSSGEELPVCTPAGTYAAMQDKYGTSLERGLFVDRGFLKIMNEKITDGEAQVLMDFASNPLEDWWQCQRETRTDNGNSIDFRFNENNIAYEEMMAIEVLGYQGRQEAAPLLVSLLNPEIMTEIYTDQSVHTHFAYQNQNSAVMQSLWLLGHNEAAEAMAGAVLVDVSGTKNNQHKIQAMRYLHAWDSDAGVPACLDVVENANDNELRKNCATYLGLRNFQGAKQVIEGESRSLAEGAIRALGLLRDSSSAELFNKTVKDTFNGKRRGDESKYFAAAAALINIGMVDEGWAAIQEQVNAKKFDGYGLLELGYIQDLDFVKNNLLPLMIEREGFWASDRARVMHDIATHSQVARGYLNDFSGRDEMLKTFERGYGDGIVYFHSGWYFGSEPKNTALIADPALASALMDVANSPNGGGQEEIAVAARNIQTFIAARGEGARLLERSSKPLDLGSLKLPALFGGSSDTSSDDKPQTVEATSKTNDALKSTNTDRPAKQPVVPTVNQAGPEDSGGGFMWIILLLLVLGAAGAGGWYYKTHMMKE